MILVTGATGFVGTNLCRTLEERGLDYLALVRSPEKAVERGLASERLLQGDLSGKLPALPEGLNLVVHLAGLLHALDPQEMLRVNEAGTQKLVERVREQAPAAKWIQVSSLAAAGPSADGGQSGLPPDLCRPVSRYGESKLAAEKVVAASGLPFVTLRPGIVYGPWDSDVLTLFRSCAKGIALLAGPSVRYSLVHVDDLVAAVLAALERSDFAGQYLPIAHEEPLGDAEWMRLIGRAVGRKIRILRLPLFAAKLTAELAELWGRMRGKAPVFGRDKYREMRAGSWICDPGPAQAHLGFRGGTAHLAGHESTAGWYRERGLL
ncbi:MAG: hypothetical protein CSA62_03675 [Planctomycetota bacterium]|nr:MAG: hypothetical protein CSA62_03675 [Planctomycetota bacterium]